MFSEAAILKDPPKKSRPQHMLQVDFLLQKCSIAITVKTNTENVLLFQSLP